MPAEWEPHSAVWLAWPHDEISFPQRLEKVENEIVKMISAIHPYEQVELLVLGEAMKTKAEAKLGTAGVDLRKITFRIIDYMDAWMRDCGGIFVFDQNGRLKLVNFIFNSWGNKFPDLLIDAEIPKKVALWLGLGILNPGLVLEGGAFDVNGQGTLLTTEQCLLNPNRNPGMSKADYEQCFRQYLGVTKTIWLKHGLVNDHTDGHIDDIARFVAPNKIVCAYEDDETEENFKTLDENYQNLKKAADAAGESFELVKLPMPHMRYAKDKPFEAGNNAPASYANFYIGNQVVLAPIFQDPNDEKALQIIRDCFPDRKVVGIDCSDLIYGGGAIHCITRQQPSIGE